MKKIAILAIAIFSASTIFAERGGFRDRSENWLKDNSTETSGGLRGEGSAPTINPGTDPTQSDPTRNGAPIGAALPVILVLGAGYAILKGKKKERL